MKQREDETCFHKSTKPQQSREQEVSSETCDTEESSSVPSELKLQLMPDQCKSFDHIRLVVEDSHLQEQLPRYTGSAMPHLSKHAYYRYFRSLVAYNCREDITLPSLIMSA